jgi:hypothetical protein
MKDANPTEALGCHGRDGGAGERATFKPTYLSGSDHMCKATLTDGTEYEVWDRLLVTERWNGKPSYLPVRGLYRPGSGEFLWRASAGFSDKGHAIKMMEKPQKGGVCPTDEQEHHILLLQNGEWIDFEALNGNITVFHSNLKFQTREEVWSYVAEHWQDADFFLASGTSIKFVKVITSTNNLGPISCGRKDWNSPRRVTSTAPSAA